MCTLFSKRLKRDAYTRKRLMCSNTLISTTIFISLPLSLYLSLFLYISPPLTAYLWTFLSLFVWVLYIGSCLFFYTDLLIALPNNVTKIVLVLSQSKGGLIAIALKKILKKKD